MLIRNVTGKHLWGEVQCMYIFAVLFTLFNMEVVKEDSVTIAAPHTGKIPCSYVCKYDFITSRLRVP